ncbi:hypothetical protein ABKN59_010231 [Abortiporus biennis]
MGSLLLKLALPLILCGMSVAIATSSTPSNPGGCLCTSGSVPIPVDIRIPVDPANGLNTTNLRRLKNTFNIFGQLCQPSNTGRTLLETDHVQLLLHGSTYTHQYWTFPMNGFQNYSYAAYACSQGQATFAYDQLGVGLSDRPSNSTDVQLPVVAQIASSLAKKLKDGTISSTLGFPNQRFKKVVAISHSQGSIVNNYATIHSTDKGFSGAESFDALILTGHIHDPGFLQSANNPRPLARDVNPSLWGTLDSGYVTTPNRSSFYPPTNIQTIGFSQQVFTLDTLTLDVSSRWITFDIASVYVPAKGYKGPVVELVGEFDQLHCLNSLEDDGGGPCNAATLQATEKIFWPDSRNFTMMVREGSGHDVNLDFGASGTFSLLSELARSLV